MCQGAAHAYYKDMNYGVLDEQTLQLRQSQSQEKMKLFFLPQRREIGKLQ